MSGDEYDLRVIALRDLALEIQSADVREFQIQNQASRHVGLWIRDVLGSRAERDYVQIESRKKLGQRLADPRVVVHDKNEGVVWVHSAALGNHQRSSSYARRVEFSAR